MLKPNRYLLKQIEGLCFTLVGTSREDKAQSNKQTVNRLATHIECWLDNSKLNKNSKRAILETVTYLRSIAYSTSQINYGAHKTEDCLKELLNNGTIDNELKGKALSLQETVYNVFRSIWLQGSKWEAPTSKISCTSPAGLLDLVSDKDWKRYSKWVDSCTRDEVHAVQQVIFKNNLPTKLKEAFRSGIKKWPYS